MKRVFAVFVCLIILGSTSVHAEKVKVPVPDFKLPTATGEVTPSQLKGKVVYVDFWASWCKPCKKSFPWLNMMHEKYKDQGLVVLGINLDSEKEMADAFLLNIPAKFTVAYDPEGQSAKDFKVMGMPSSYLINREGYVIGSHVGFREKDAEALEQAVAKLLHQ